MIPGAARDLTDEGDIERLVVDFYRAAAMDAVLGPVFEAAHVDWPQHIATIKAFWSWQLLGIRGYDGNPLLAHRPSHARTPFTVAHFERWCTLFVETVDASFTGPRADAAKVRALKMAGALQRLLRNEWGAGEEGVPVLVRRRVLGWKA